MISYHIISYQFISYHIIPYHIISYQLHKCKTKTSKMSLPLVTRWWRDGVMAWWAWLAAAAWVKIHQDAWWEIWGRQPHEIGNGDFLIYWFLWRKTRGKTWNPMDANGFTTSPHETVHKLTGAFYVGNGWEWGLLGWLLVIMHHSRKFPAKHQ